MAATDADTWLQAMKSEMDSIHKNQTFLAIVGHDTMDLPLNLFFDKT